MRFAWNTLTLLVIALLLLGCAGGAGSGAVEPAADAGPGPGDILKEYVDTPDPAYGWTLVNSEPSDGYTLHTIEMTSQTWLTEAEVDRPLWTHWLMVVEPDEIRSDHAFLYISGGRNGGDPPEQANPLTLQPALATGSFTAELRMVPNQPLTFVGDDYGPRVEDELIAYGWDKFLRGEDPIWLARLPMTKAAVRAMDTMTAFAASEDGGGNDVSRFVVAGGSKRGWTTWTTGMVDDRVVAIAPIVIDLLNLEPSFEHHWKAYGFWAPAIGDYVYEGITDWFGTPEYLELQKIVEPYNHLDKLTMPKYLINATGEWSAPTSTGRSRPAARSPPGWRTARNRAKSCSGRPRTRRRATSGSTRSAGPGPAPRSSPARTASGSAPSPRRRGAGPPSTSSSRSRVPARRRSSSRPRSRWCPRICRSAGRRRRRANSSRQFSGPEDRGQSPRVTGERSS